MAELSDLSGHRARRLLFKCASLHVSLVFCQTPDSSDVCEQVDLAQAQSFQHKY